MQLDNLIENEKTKDFHKKFTYYKNLYLGEHQEVFDINKFEYLTQPEFDYIRYNFTGIITRIFSDLLYSERPEVTFEADDQANAWSNFVKKNLFWNKLRNATDTASFSGNSVLKTVIQKDGIKLLQPSNLAWYPELNSFNIADEALSQNLVYEKEVEKKKVYLVEKHTAGFIEYFSFIKERGKIQEVSPNKYWAEELRGLKMNVLNRIRGVFRTETGIDRPLLTVLTNLTQPEDYFGVSDYSTSIIAKIKKINELYNQAQYVINKNSDPKMLVPREVIDQAISEMQKETEGTTLSSINNIDEQFNNLNLFKQSVSLQRTIVASKIIKKLEFLGGEIDTIKPEYIEYKGSLDENRKQREALINDLMQEAGISKVLLDPDLAIGQASGVAIMRLAQTTLNKAKQKQTFVENAIKNIASIVMQANGFGPVEPSVTWSDGLVNNQSEIITNQIDLLNNNLTTQQRAIAVINAISDAEASEIINQIKNENNLFSLNNNG